MGVIWRGIKDNLQENVTGNLKRTYAYMPSKAFVSALRAELRRALDHDRSRLSFYLLGDRLPVQRASVRMDTLRGGGRTRSKDMVGRAVVFSLLLCASPAVAQQESNATQVFQRNSPAVVTIETSSGFGSGVLVDSTGVIVTNFHVVQDEPSATITLANGDTYDDVGVIAADPKRDLVLLNIKGFELPSAEMGDSDGLVIGQDVYALGAPQRLALTISEGIVSGRRDHSDGYNIIQTTAPISPGSSGGGLFDQDGLLIGITTFKYEDGESLNFAVPINYVRDMFSTSRKWSLSEFTAQDGQDGRARGVSRIQ